VPGEKTACLVATRDIAIHEEIMWNYGVKEKETDCEWIRYRMPSPAFTKVSLITTDNTCTPFIIYPYIGISSMSISLNASIQIFPFGVRTRAG